jgi:L-aminopeptidase/D-esterase-like protein
MFKSFKIGHFSDIERGTGCTVILCPKNIRASAHARGVSPGTREFALLSPYRKMQDIHALFLTGGSAFGLDAAGGVMRYLKDRGAGYKTPYGNIPIVPAAVIFDLPVIDSSAYPLPDDAYQACLEAKSNFTEQGTLGAGTGATVGKWAGLAHLMKGGIGISEMRDGDLTVRCLSVVNPVGDVIDEFGQTIAGASRNGKFLADRSTQRRWNHADIQLGNNTILIAVMTNAALEKIQLYYLAERAHNGIVQAVAPAHTSFDGDIVFTLTTNEIETEIDNLTEITIETVRQSIINAVLQAESLGGIPALKSRLKD